MRPSKRRAPGRPDAALPSWPTRSRRLPRRPAGPPKKQTGRATEEIESQVSKVQSVTANVVAAIQDIIAKIGEMNSIAAAVAGAVDQQRAATQTIAQNAQQALSSAVDVVNAIVGIEEASTATKIEADQVLDAAAKLSQQSDDLHVEFDRFAAGVRAA